MRVHLPQDIPPPQFWDQVAVLALQWPFVAGLGAGAGYLGHQLLQCDENILKKKQMVGGVMVAMFTGSVGFFFLDALGFPEKLAIPLALLFGSSGEVGYQLLISRAKQVLNGKK